MSSIQSVIIIMINKSDSRCAVVGFCYHSYDYRLISNVPLQISNVPLLIKYIELVINSADKSRIKP